MRSRRTLSPQGPGVFAIPGLVKIERKIVPAKPEQKGVPNPFKPGELRDIAGQAGFGEDQGPGLEEPQGHGGVRGNDEIQMTK